MKKLFKVNSLISKYAYCYGCKEYFIDNLPLLGSVFCPNGCGMVVERGIRKIVREGK